MPNKILNCLSANDKCRPPGVEKLLLSCFLPMVSDDAQMENIRARCLRYFLQLSLIIALGTNMNIFKRAAVIICLS